MNAPIKLINPLSDQPTEMWMQAIGDFEVVLTTPGYKINMDYWYETCLEEACLVCMAGASMARRAEHLPIYAELWDFDNRTALKFESINMMREGHFEDALNWLSLPEKDEERWLEAVGKAITRTDIEEIGVANETHDWRGLIKLLREAIGRIEAEYAKITGK